MTHVAAGFLLNVMALSAIGLGPSLWLLSGKDRGGVAFAICPVVGLVLVSVFGTILTVGGRPVSHWATPVLIVGVFVSIVLTVYSIARDRDVLVVENPSQLFVPLVAFACAGVLILAPQMLGGLQYSILRGNGSDSFNYLAGATALDHEPMSWIFSASPQALVEQHPSYLRARELLDSRWTTMMVLAFSSRLAGIDPYKFEYAFSALCLLLAFGPIVLWCRRLLDLRPLASAFTAAAICIGFWGQFVLDERADAHQNVVPILLLLTYLVVRIETLETDRMRWGEHVLLGLTAAALLFVYPEIAPMTLLGTVAFLGLRLLRGGLSQRRLAGWAFSLGLAVVAAVPLRDLLTRFFAFQFNYAATGVNSWHIAYFRWLYLSPLTGLWGFGPLVAPHTLSAYAFRAVLWPVGAILTVALGVAIVRASRVALESPGTTLSAALAAAALAQWTYLCLRGQFWAGAKGLSFGYPFLILSVVGYGLSRASISPTGWRASWKTAVATAVIVFLALQSALAVYRPWLAARGEDYAGYIDGHGEYRRHAWDLTPFERILKPQHGLTVWVNVSNVWVADYLGLALGDGVHLINVGADRDVAELGAPRQQSNRAPDYLIVDSSNAHPGAGIATGIVVATTRDLSLVHVSDAPIVASIENPNGVEGSPAQPFLWLGGPATVVHIVAASDGCALLRAHFTLGPSRPDLPYRHLTLATETDPAPPPVLISEGVHDLTFRTTKGLSQLRLHVEDAATVLLPGDRRPLLLRVDDLRLEHAACPIGVK